MLRCIGKGSYGEVWLAESVTGAMRAVKVVRREDFELDRTFEREFEGIRKFEPVSRNHPGLVHVLHVGRNDEEGFYYYVMELGDDRETGSRINPADYEPRTLGGERQMRKRLSVMECLEYGAQIAEGLAHMHDHGLTHRDIKPSNIIFVEGKPKLADIGLVAAAGQRTFVGTEGFVPPEGPGSTAADVYSLGMVLYELSTGKDRMQFPEVPSRVAEPNARRQWRALNEIICKACAPSPKHRYPTARQMALALRRAQRLRGGRGRWLLHLVTVPAAAAVIAFLLATWRHGGAMPWPPGRFAAQAASEVELLPLSSGSVEIISEPSGAAVFYEGEFKGNTPLLLYDIPAGEAEFLLQRNRYRETTVRVTGIGASDRPAVARVKLPFYNPPVPHMEWRNGLDMIFDWDGETHISRRPVNHDQFIEIMPFRVADVVPERTPENEMIYVPRVPAADAERFCRDLTRREYEAGYLEEDQCYRPVEFKPTGQISDDPGKRDYICFRLRVERYGHLEVHSEPFGAPVYEDGVLLGPTPLNIYRHVPGPVNLRVTLQGYQDETVTGFLPSGGKLHLDVELKRSRLPDFRASSWHNSLDLTFVPLNDPESNVASVLICNSETRVRDYAEFAKATNRPLRITDADQDGKDDLGQRDTHPVVNITREDAKAFCVWLTERERRLGYLDGTLFYRLPNDLEWSLAAGSPNIDESRRTPAQRHNGITGQYPWMPVYEWPPPRGGPDSHPAGNFADLAALRANSVPSLTPEQRSAIELLGYDDGEPFTSPAGSFAPNGTGLYDMAGNVWEFVSDDYGAPDPEFGDPDPAKQKYAVVRGASWATPASDKNQLGIHYRRAVPADIVSPEIGFRIVLNGPPARKP